MEKEAKKLKEEMEQQRKLTEDSDSGKNENKNDFIILYKNERNNKALKIVTNNIDTEKLN